MTDFINVIYSCWLQLRDEVIEILLDYVAFLLDVKERADVSCRWLFGTVVGVAGAVVCVDHVEEVDEVVSLVGLDDEFV